MIFFFLNAIFFALNSNSNHKQSHTQAKKEEIFYCNSEETEGEITSGKKKNKKNNINKRTVSKFNFFFNTD